MFTKMTTKTKTTTITGKSVGCIISSSSSIGMSVDKRRDSKDPKEATSS